MSTVRKIVYFMTSPHSYCQKCNQFKILCHVSLDISRKQKQSYCQLGLRLDFSMTGEICQVLQGKHEKK